MTGRRAPADWFDDWPHGQPHPDAPRAAAWAAHLARAIDDHVANSPGRVAALAEQSGVSIATIRDVREGRRWPSLHTAAALLDSMV